MKYLLNIEPLPYASRPDSAAKTRAVYGWEPLQPTRLNIFGWEMGQIQWPFRPMSTKVLEMIGFFNLVVPACQFFAKKYA